MPRGGGEKEPTTGDLKARKIAKPSAGRSASSRSRLCGARRSFGGETARSRLFHQLFGGKLLIAGFRRRVTWPRQPDDAGKNKEHAGAEQERVIEREKLRLLADELRAAVLRWTRAVAAGTG
ncbi:MAG: hypothetical protein N2444_05035 [Methylocystis sp.]|nr:hypothetical protein [Methylocystis sp.]